MAFQVVYRERVFRFGMEEKPDWSSYCLATTDTISHAQRTVDEIVVLRPMPKAFNGAYHLQEPLVRIPGRKDDRYGAWWRESHLSVTIADAEAP